MVPAKAAAPFGGSGAGEKLGTGTASALMRVFFGNQSHTSRYLASCAWHTDANGSWPRNIFGGR